MIIACYSPAALEVVRSCAAQPGGDRSAVFPCHSARWRGAGQLPRTPRFRSRKIVIRFVCMSAVPQSNKAVRRALLTALKLPSVVFKALVPSTLNRYVLSELVVPLALGVAAFGGLGLSIGVASEMSALQKTGISFGRSIASAVALALLRMPYYAACVMPMTCLLAPLLGFGRMKGDSELVALQAAGVRTQRLVLPSVLLFGIATGLQLALGELVAPHANAAAVSIVASARCTSDAPKRAQPVLFTEYGSVKLQPQARDGPPAPETQRQAPRAEDREARAWDVRAARGASGPLSRVFYAADFDGQRMHTVSVVDLEQAAESSWPVAPSQVVPRSSVMATRPGSIGTGKGATGKAGTDARKHARVVPRRAIMAQSGTWDEGTQTWLFHEGAEYVVRQVGQVSPGYASITPGEQRGEAGAMPPIVAGKGLSYAPGSGFALESVNVFERKAVAGLSRLPLDLAIYEAKDFDSMTLSEVKKLARLQSLCRNEKMARKLEVKLRQRIALPFACIVFGALGSIVGLRLPFSEQRLGFAIALSIMFGYYMVSVVGGVLGQLSIIPAMLAAWLPNMVGGMLAVALLVTA
eukprot:jgi/Mesvir1/23617/Mv18298-RA.1